MILQGNSVLILPDKQPERTLSGNIIIPITTKALAPEEGTIVLCGPACEEVKARMHVKFSRKTASVIEIEGKTHYMVSEDANQILFIYE